MKPAFLILLITFISGIFTFSIFALYTHSFWFYSAVDISILKLPTLYIGDAIFIPLFNYFLFELYVKTKSEINFIKYSTSFNFFLILSILISFTINYLQHISWIKDQYSGFIDLKPNVLSVGGWWHLIFASLEMTVMLLLLWVFTIIILEKNLKGFILSKKLFWIFFLYSSLSILDFTIKEYFVVKYPHLLKDFLNNLLEMKVFYIGVLLLTGYYIIKVNIFNAQSSEGDSEGN